MSSERKSVGELFVENWPAIARAAGLVIGFVELGASLAGRPVSTEVLAFAGGLIVAPNIAGVQAKRNDRREP